MRVAAIDIGTNSTRLLVAEVTAAGQPRELVRESRVTRLGEGVDASGKLAQRAIERTIAVLVDYRALIERHGCAASRAVLTSAVRDALNGPEFAEQVRSQFGLDARTLSGDEEARLTFLGAMSARAQAPTGPASPTAAPQADAERREVAVIDIGGGSTEIVIGSDRLPRFHTSLQLGVVRMSERHIHHDPPRPHELDRLRQDVRTILLDGLPATERAAVDSAIAVAGTATSAAAIDQELDPYDPARVEGYHIGRARIEAIGARLAGLDEGSRRQVRGLHPDRAPTIVAGMVILAECLGAFGLAAVEVSEHDILYGAALTLAAQLSAVAEERP